ncbi:hypothetical protein tinsulaeT_26870 [Thalassotalea insulae]|uniref:DUF3019 domain-containing protein n=1 Tax=Thalassotalea insulae TaxID=2056778 RepID=A0ABQ6GTV9_9GAMM|nr:DUF3019 domain-containing protein [Thalassotalea insulae]GLX79347.1 hypothetical protein tinsulaeT_26870 [Thalassotalea insulae]
MSAIKNLVVLSLIILIQLSSVCYAQDNVIELQPNQCIAVHQGEKCYVDISLNWQTQQSGNYCLFSSQQQAPLLCWQNSLSGHFEQETIANENVIFYLKAQHGSEILAQKELKMAWVYKKSVRARTSWRLF